MREAVSLYVSQLKCLAESVDIFSIETKYVFSETACRVVGELVCAADIAQVVPVPVS